MNGFARGAVAAMVMAACGSGVQAASDHLPWPEAQAIVDHVKLPDIPDKVFQASDYGIRDDGKTDNTAAFANAIDTISAAGGGHLVVPPGNFVSGAIRLKSHVDLNLSRGATILFSADVTKYPMELTRYQGIDLMNTSPLIGARDQTDFSITGKGVLDASATGKWNKDTKGLFATLTKMGDEGTPIEKRVFGPQRSLRTACLEPNNCTNVLIQGITIRGSHFWQMHPLLCDNLTVDDVTTESHGSQTDGCDPESCSNVVIKNCLLGADDDCIAIKSGRNPDSQRVHKPCENLVIMDTKFHGPWGMITCGSEQSEGIQHVYVYNCSTENTLPDIRKQTGVRYILFFKTNSKRGGFIRDIHIDSVTGKFNAELVRGGMNYGGQGEERGTNYPDVRNIYLSNITDQSAEGFLDLTGLNNDPISNFVFTDCTFTNVAHPDKKATFVNGLTFQNVTVNGKPMN